MFNGFINLKLSVLISVIRIASSGESQHTIFFCIFSIQQRRHARVKTWTRHVDLFEKDFIVVPINERFEKNFILI